MHPPELQSELRTCSIPTNKISLTNPNRYYQTDPLKKIIYVVLLISLITGAVYIRFHNLDKFGFWSDELYHVIAAQGLIDNDRPSFPSGVEYRRALSYTFLVSKSFQIFGVNEMAARLPSVLFNILFIFSGYFIIKNWYNKNSAIIFCIIMGFSPYILQITRQSRMYTAFQLFYFLGTYLFWVGFERSGRIHSFEAFKNMEQKYDINIIYIVIALIIFFVSYHFHQLTLTFAFVIWFYIVIVLFSNPSKISISEILKYKYGIALALSIGIALLILIIHPGYYVSMLHGAIRLPGWKMGEHVDVKLFSWILRAESPIFFFLYPISTLYIIKKDFKKGLYIVLSFLIPFLLHSFVFKWKEERFMMYFYPFYILSIAVLVEEIINIICHEMRHFKTKIKILDNLVPVCFVFSMFIFLYPWFFNSRNVTNYVFWTDWKPSLKNTSTLLKQDSKIITLLDDQSFIFYYLKKGPDYYIAPKIYYQDEDTEYKYFNSKPVKTVKDLSSIVGSNHDVWVLARKDEYFNENRYYRKDIMDYIGANFNILNSVGDKDILVFRSK